ncbi:type II toxin-antitoxin system HigA family antitoxin [Jiella sp. M17.18]|uniref:helix-turn-helix domain-containing protein n=1 Tax=Jiella sp. M17.18 TaxID=3234247 RepID=UPI0034E03970
MADEIRPIRTEADYEAALAEIEALWGAPGGTTEGDRLDVLATLIEAYETSTFPMDPPDPVDAIVFRMEQQGLLRKDLEPIIGDEARVTAVLDRKIALSIEMIRRLHEQLGISADILIRPMRRDEAA